MGITIKDIAEKTNLSITTVSLVLNNKASRISQKTKDLVLRTAKELNYRPNQLAVGLITKRTKTIGIIVPDIRNLFFSTLAKGIEDECRKNGWTVILCNTSDIHERDMEYIRMLASKGVDGILYCMSRDTSLALFEECYDLLNLLDIPYIMVDRSFQIPGLITAQIDHVTGGYLATKHLLELGHKRIGCVTGPSHLFDSNSRLQGYQNALKEFDIEYDQELIIEGNYDIDSGVEAINHLVNKNVSAIFAYNDMMAYGVYKGLKSKNLVIPRDISVIGYDDVFISETLDIPLTTIHQPVEKIGSASAKHLIDIIENGLSDTKIPTFAPSLIVRESTAEFVN